MKLQISGRITGQKMADSAMYLLVLLLCLPISMQLPSIIRMPLQIIAVLEFVVALVLLKEYKQLVVLLILFLVSFLYYMASWNEMMDASTFLYNSLCAWISVIYGVLYIKKVIHFNMCVLRFFVIVIVLTAFTTIVGLMKYPLAVRELGRGESYSGTNIKALYRSKNIASWSQVYGMVFFVGVLSYYYRETKKKAILFSIIPIEVCILLSQLTFGMIISLALLLLVLINPQTRNQVLLVGFVLVLGIFIVLEYDSILLWIIGISRNMGLEMLAPKLEDLYNVVVLRTATGDATSRFDLYIKSLSGFKTFPFGMYWTQNVVATRFIGYHSDLFDEIGSLGILGIIIIASFSVRWTMWIQKVKGSYKRRYLFVSFFLFGLLFALNPVFYSPQVWLGAFSFSSMVVSQSNHGTIRSVYDGQAIN